MISKNKIFTSISHSLIYFRSVQYGECTAKWVLNLENKLYFN